MRSTAFYAIMGTPGPMARNVPDLAALLSVQAGYDPRAPLSNRQDPAQFAGPLKRDFKGARIAWAGDFGGHLPFEPGILDLCKAALKVFESLGCTVEEAMPDYPIEQVWQNWKILRAWQSGSALKALLRRSGQARADEARGAVRGRKRPQAFRPTTSTTPTWSAPPGIRRCAPSSSATIIFCCRPRRCSRSTPTTDWPKEIDGKTMDTYHRWMEVMIPVTMASCPALSVPVGFSDRGLPMGLQIVGPNHGELACLQLAHAYDEATEWVTKRPPPLLGWSISYAAAPCFPFAQDKLQIAQIDEHAEALARDEHRIAAVERIDEQQQPAADRAPPERHRNDAPADPFRGNPLHQRSAR